jgi:hypothetical protein
MTLARSLALVSLGALACASRGHAQGYSFRLVAQTGDPAPGSLGGHFTWLGWPTINASGQVAFAAGSDGAIADTGMWRTAFNDPQSSELIIGQDYPVPGSPPEIRFGQFDPSFHHPLLNDAGNVGFSAPLTNMPDPANGLFRMVNGSIQRVAVQGDVAPGTAGTATYASVSNLPSFNASNSLAFGATLAGPGVNASNDRAYFAHWFGGVQMFVREGNAVPDMPGTVFSFGPSSFPTLEASGAIGFTAATTGATAMPWSLWRGWPGAIDSVALDGQPTPVGGTFAVDGGLFNFWDLSPGVGTLAFHADAVLPVGSLSGIWGMSGGVLNDYAVVDHPGPLGAYKALQSSSAQVAEDGTAAFWASFQGGSENTDSAIIRSPLGGPATIMVREGDAAEGFGPGVVFDDMGGWYTPLPLINDAHQIVLDAFVRGPRIGLENNRGLWLVDVDGTLHNLLREGQLLSIGGQAPRQVISWVVSFGICEHGGRRPGVNDRGDVAIQIAFADETAAVVVAQRPGPCESDLNNDGFVDAADLAILLGAWGNVGPIGEGADVDWDGDTDGADLAVLLGAWGVCEG